MDWIEIVGYVGSALVLVSFLMTSVFKLRVVNTIGSLIFAVYALIIHSYPTALMNICLVIINLHFLWNMRKGSKTYELIQLGVDDKFLEHLLSSWRTDIEECFPKIDLNTKGLNAAYLVTCDGMPVGVSMGNVKGEKLDLRLDYTTPAYRDFSVGAFLFERLAEMGITTVEYNGPTMGHGAYLARMGFAKRSDGYIRHAS